jgi:hypothetical protein
MQLITMLADNWLSSHWQLLFMALLDLNHAIKQVFSSVFLCFLVLGLAFGRLSVYFLVAGLLDKFLCISLLSMHLTTLVI